MRKLTGIVIIVLSTGVAYADGIGVSFTPGLWRGDGPFKSAPIYALGFRAGYETIGYELSIEYREWKATEYSFYTLNLDNYLAIHINAGNPVSLFVMPFVGYGTASFSHLPEYYVDENFEIVNLGGKFGVRGEYAEGFAIIDMYFYYRGGMVQGGEEIDYLVTTKIGLDTYIRPIKYLGIKLSVGGLSDNFSFYEGMGSYFHFGSPFITLGPEVSF